MLSGSAVQLRAVLIFLSELPRGVDSCQIRSMFNRYISAASGGRVELASGCELCVVVLGHVDSCSAASHVWSFSQSCLGRADGADMLELLVACCSN